MAEPIVVRRDALRRYVPAPRPERPEADPAGGNPGAELAMIADRLFARARKIAVANIGDLLGRLEDPAKLTRLAVVQLEERLAHAVAARAVAAREEQWLRRQCDLLRGRPEPKSADQAERYAAEAQDWSDALRALDADIAELGERLRQSSPGRHFDPQRRAAIVAAELQALKARGRQREI